MTKMTFREQVLQARENAIVETVNRLLAGKGFDLMTVDEVAAEVGIAKASLYKHFPSKEALAAAAMVRVLERTQQALAQIETEQTDPLERLRATVRWVVQVQLAGEMPVLPSQNSSLRAVLLSHPAYLDHLMAVSDTLGAWIVAAQASGQISPDWPPQVVLYTLFARACDPVPAFLRASGAFDDAQTVDWVLRICFEGLRSR